MAQPGFTPLVNYNTTTPAAVPLTGNLLKGELAINVADKKVYTKDGFGNVIQIGSGPDAIETLTNKTLTSPAINTPTGITKNDVGLGAAENKPFSTGIPDAEHAAATKAAPVDADEFSYLDSAASWVLKKLTWANVKATLAAWINGNNIPASLTSVTSSGAINANSGLVLGTTTQAYQAGSFGYTDANWGCLFRPPRVGALYAFGLQSYAGINRLTVTDAGVTQLNVQSILGSPAWSGGTQMLNLLAAAGSAYGEPTLTFQEAGSNVGAMISGKNTANGAMDLIFANRDTSSTTSTMKERWRVTSDGHLSGKNNNQIRLENLAGVATPVLQKSSDNGVYLDNSDGVINIRPGNAGALGTAITLTNGGNAFIPGALMQGTVVTVTAATHTVANNTRHIVCNFAGTVTLTLPAAAGAAGRMLNIKTIQNQLVVSAASNVYPISTATLGTAICAATAGNWAMLVSDGTNWSTMEAG